MNSIQVICCFVPLAVYLGFILWVNSRKRPFMLNGVQDFAFLAFGIIGFVIVGPVSFTLPIIAIERYGIFVWPMLVALYLLFVPLISWSMRQHLVIYNIKPEELGTVFSDIFSNEKLKAEKIGNSVMFPGLGIQFYVEFGRFSRTVSLVATSRNQSPNSWKILEQLVQESLEKVKVSPNPACFAIFGFAAISMFFSVLYAIKLFGI